jgi:hypothetical protein
MAVLRTSSGAASNIPVLVEGESGVGRNCCPRIHGSSERKSKPFVAVNCGAIPDNLVDQSCSVTRRVPSPAPPNAMSKFVEASGGTLFLDEVGVVALAAQETAARCRKAPSRRSRPQTSEGRRPHHFRDQPQAARPRERRRIPRGPVLPAARAAADDPALADAARTSRICCGISWRALPPRKIASPASAARPWLISRNSTGPATSASSRTRCIAPLS